MSIQKLLGMALPIIQAPMAGSQGSSLAIAVTTAGGLGSLPCALLSVDEIGQEIRTFSSCTTKPLNVNFFCHPEPRADPLRETAWRKRLQPYYDEFKINADSSPASARRAFNAEMMAALAPFRPRIVSFHFGLPDDEFIAELKSWGTKILSSATTVEEARWLEAHGVDAIIAQGYEAGGHRGMFLTEDLQTQVGMLALVPQIVRSVSVPVIAAGGIADHRGVKAVLELGASAAQVGTTFLLCPEAKTTPVHRAALKRINNTSAITNIFTGRAARGVVNRFMREVGPMNTDAPAFPRAAAVLAPLRAAAERQGSGDFSPLWSGQNPSGCKEISATELTRELAAASA